MALEQNEEVEMLGEDEGEEALGEDELGEDEGEEFGENEVEEFGENEGEKVEEFGENEAEEEEEVGEGEGKNELEEMGGFFFRQGGVEEEMGNDKVDEIPNNLMEEKAHYEVQNEEKEENDKVVEENEAEYNENSEIEEYKENEGEVKREKDEDKESIYKKEDETEKCELGRKLDKLNVNDDDDDDDYGDEVRGAAKTRAKDNIPQKDRKLKETGDWIQEKKETKILTQGGTTAKAGAEPFQKDKQKPMTDQHKRKETRIKRTKTKGGKNGEQNIKQNYGTKSKGTETGEREHEEREPHSGGVVQNWEEMRKAKGNYDGKVDGEEDKNSEKEEEMVKEKGEEVALSSPSNTSSPGPTPSQKSLTGWYRPKAPSPSSRALYPTEKEPLSTKTYPQPQAATLTDCPLTQAVNSGASSAFHPTPVPQLMDPGLSGPSTDCTLVPKEPAQSLDGMGHGANENKSQVPKKE
uniref:cilia- and flagella-associated protein 251-like isoform X3 n=1 Tax=Myxine glutinosa TaxID=7769 RepID=UPI00358E0571